MIEDYNDRTIRDYRNRTPKKRKGSGHVNAEIMKAKQKRKRSYAQYKREQDEERMREQAD